MKATACRDDEGAPVFVLTIDQRSSRRRHDEVPALLDGLNRYHRRDGLVRRFERTAGDEVQGVLEAPGLVVDLVFEMMRGGRWSVGVGIGPVDTPLPRSTRAGSGAAFLYARDAVNRAKSAPHHVCVIGDDHRAPHVETVFWLVGAVLRRRSERGWEVVDMLADGMTQAEVADALGVSAPAISQRLTAAGWAEQQRGQQLAVSLLEGS